MLDGVTLGSAKSTSECVFGNADLLQNHGRFQSLRLYLKAGGGGLPLRLVNYGCLCGVYAPAG